MHSSTTSTPRRSRLTFIGVTAAAGAVLAVGLTASSASAASGEYAGTLADGTAWRAVVPDDWNGTLLLYSHGYQPSFAGPRAPATVAPNRPPSSCFSNRDTRWWDRPTRRPDGQCPPRRMTSSSHWMPLWFRSASSRIMSSRTEHRWAAWSRGDSPIGGRRDRGRDADLRSDGGRRRPEQLSARRLACDRRLLAPEQDIQIEGYASLDAALGTAAALTGAVEAGQSTPAGRARVALAAALFHLPGTDTRDADAWQKSMYTLLKQTLGFVTPGRFDIETATGGNATWNVGVDYGRLFQQSEDRQKVAELYRAAGLDLKADLAQLTDTADIAPDAGSVGTLNSTSGLTGDLQVPVLTMHTTIDILAPVQVEEEYAEDVRSQGDSAMLRQTFVERKVTAVHPCEIAAGISVLEDRVNSGHWGGASNSVPQLNALAASLHDSGSAFVTLPPREFVGDRVWE